jgi:hypothetical protein
MEMYAKHKSQVSRERKNLSKSVKLDIKKACNRQIKLVRKDKNISESTRKNIINFYTKIAKSLFDIKESNL